MGPVNWRYWLIDLPARLTEVGYTWYRLYLTALLIVAAVVVPFMAVTTLVLAAFGIRWGW